MRCIVDKSLLKRCTRFVPRWPEQQCPYCLCLRLPNQWELAPESRRLHFETFFLRLRRLVVVVVMVVVVMVVVLLLLMVVVLLLLMVVVVMVVVVLQAPVLVPVALVAEL